MTTNSDERAVPQIDGCTFSHYRASAAGRVRSVDRRAGGRYYRGVVLKTRLNNSGYVLVTMSCDNPEHRAHTHTMQKVILTTFTGPCPPGMQARHLDSNPENNACQNLAWGTKEQNEADKPVPPVLEASHPCRNAPRCGNLVVNEGRRCPDCVAEVGRQAAAMLNAGMNLQDVAEVFGYTGPDWVFKLAVQHGGYAGTKAEARTQHPGLAARARLRVRFRRELRAAATQGGDGQ
jgi:hypothetical protein